MAILPSQLLPTQLLPSLDQWFSMRLEKAYAPVRNVQRDFFPKLLENLKIRYECPVADLKRIPTRGPVMIVVNHPMGLPDGIVMGALLESVRPDFRFMANSLLMQVPQLRKYVIPVDPFGGADAVERIRLAAVVAGLQRRWSSSWCRLARRGLVLAQRPLSGNRSPRPFFAGIGFGHVGSIRRAQAFGSLGS